MRDLLLRLPVRDLDLAYEGDAAALARDVAEGLGASARVHGRFGTATVETPAGERLDFAATRRERYASAGALPQVEPAAIADDLARRDFTVNAMAIEIAPGRGRSLIDPFGGRRDLALRRIRILHPGSFRDDPTRAYRAARYANRLRFSVEPATRRAAAAAVEAGIFDRISGDRRRREIALLFSEPKRAEAVRRLARLGLPATLSPALDARPRTLARLAAAEALPSGAMNPHTIWILYVLVWSVELEAEEARGLAARLNLTGRPGRMLRGWAAQDARLRRLPRRPPSSAFAALGLTPEETAAAAVAAHRPDVRAAARRHLSRSPVCLAIRGADLVRAGLRPGRAVGKALAATLAARLDGKISAEQELPFALEAAREGAPAR